MSGLKINEVFDDSDVAGVNKSGGVMLDVCVQSPVYVCNIFFKKREKHKKT